MHARNLAVFALIYKSVLLALRSAQGKEKSAHPFLAGLAGGYYVFGRYKSSVSQQIVIYVFARVVLAAASLAFQPPGDNTLVGAKYGGRGGVGFLGDALGLSVEARERVRKNAWPLFASLSWASVMWMFRWYPDMLQPSLRSSMVYMSVFAFGFVGVLGGSTWLATIGLTHALATITRITGIHLEISSYTTNEHQTMITNEDYDISRIFAVPATFERDQLRCSAWRKHASCRTGRYGEYSHHQSGAHLV